MTTQADALRMADEHEAKAEFWKYRASPESKFHRETAAMLREYAEGVDGWRPIETAPKKGRQLILLLTPSRFPQVAFSNTWWTCGFSVECKPTHWMELPELPPLNAALSGRENT